MEHILTLKPSGIRRQGVIHAKTGSWLACTTAHRPHDGFPAAWMSLGNLRVVTPSLTRGCMWQGSTTAAAPGRIQRGCVGFTARTAFQAQSWDTAAPVTHTASRAVSEGSREPDSRAAPASTGSAGTGKRHLSRSCRASTGAVRILANPTRHRQPSRDIPVQAEPPATAVEPRLVPVIAVRPPQQFAP